MFSRTGSASGTSTVPATGPAVPTRRSDTRSRMPLTACDAWRRGCVRSPSMAWQPVDFGRFSSKRGSQPRCYRPPVLPMPAAASSRSSCYGRPGGARRAERRWRPSRVGGCTGVRWEPGSATLATRCAEGTISSLNEHCNHSRIREGHARSVAARHRLAARHDAQGARTAAAHGGARRHPGHRRGRAGLGHAEEVRAPSAGGPAGIFERIFHGGRSRGRRGVRGTVPRRG